MSVQPAAARPHPTRLPDIRKLDFRIQLQNTQIELLRDQMETLKLTISVVREEMALAHREIGKMKRMLAHRTKHLAPVIDPNLGQPARLNPRLAVVVRDTLVPLDRNPVQPAAQPAAPLRQ